MRGAVGALGGAKAALRLTAAAQMSTYSIYLDVLSGEVIPWE